MKVNRRLKRPEPFRRRLTKMLLDYMGNLEPGQTEQPSEKANAPE